eukprot:225118_1
MSATTTTTTVAPPPGEEKLALDDWGYFLMTISWIFTVVSFVICCYAVYAGYHHYQQKKATSKNAQRLSHQLKVIVLTIVCMWIFTAISICDSIGLPHWFAKDQGDYSWWYTADTADSIYETNNNWEDWWFNWEHSDKSYLMWNVFWAVAKITLYVVYLHRIYTIFGGTKYAPNQATYCLIAIGLLIQTGLVCAWCWFYNISWSCCEIWADDQYETLAWLAWLILIMDIMLSLGLVFLFLFCMKQLFGAIKGHQMARNMEMSSIGSKSELSGNSRTGASANPNGEVQTVVTTEPSDRQENLVKTATRVFVLAMISLFSSIFYQLLFGIAITEEFYGSHVHTAFYYFSFTWNVDSTLNVICLYLSMAFAKGSYYKICKCDGCCYECIKKMTTEE